MFQLLGLCTRSDHCKQTKSLNITILASTCSHLAPMDVLPSYLHEDTNILVIFPLMYTRIDVLCLNILLQTFLTQRRSSTTANWISNLEWSVEFFHLIQLHPPVLGLRSPSQYSSLSLHNLQVLITLYSQPRSSSPSRSNTEEAGFSSLKTTNQISSNLYIQTISIPVDPGSGKPFIYRRIPVSYSSPPDHHRSWSLFVSYSGCPASPPSPMPGEALHGRIGEKHWVKSWARVEVWSPRFYSARVSKISHFLIQPHSATSVGFDIVKWIGLIQSGKYLFSSLDMFI